MYSSDGRYDESFSGNAFYGLTRQCLILISGIRMSDFLAANSFMLIASCHSQQMLDISRLMLLADLN